MINIELRFGAINTTITEGGAMKYLGARNAAQIPTLGVSEGDTYRISSLEGTVGTLKVELDDIITYKDGSWVMFADHRETYIQSFTSPDFSKLREEHGKGHSVYVTKRWNASGLLYSSFLYRANLNTRGSESFFGFVAIEPMSGNTGISIVQYELREDDTAWTVYSHIDYPTPSVINTTTSTSTTNALSANMGKELQDQISNLKARGRYLSVWNCTTGLAETSPTVDPYEYKAGDYFIVGVVGTGTKYKPSGSTYSEDEPSTAVETSDVKVNDTYYYDGSVWTLLSANMPEISFASLAGNPTDNTNLASALNDKADQEALDTVQETAAEALSGLDEKVSKTGDTMEETLNFYLPYTLSSGVIAAIYVHRRTSGVHRLIDFDGVRVLSTYYTTTEKYVAIGQPGSVYDIRVAGKLLPMSTGYDLGNTSMRFGTLYVNEVQIYRIYGSRYQFFTPIDSHQLEEALDTKADKISAANKIYGTDGSGAQKAYDLNDIAIPQLPSGATDGTYTLKCTKSDGVVNLEWIKEQ